MRLAKLAAAALLGIVLLSSVACATPTYHLSTSVNGQGSIVPSSGEFLEGRTITIFANPAYGWAFDHWEGALSGNQSLANLKMNADKSITAYFIATNETATQTSQFTTHTEDVVGFSISVPSYWEEASLGDAGAIYTSTSPCSESYSSVNVLKMDASGLSLQSAYEASKTGIELFEEYDLLSEEALTIGGIPAMKITYTWIIWEDSVQTMQCILVKEETGWVITFTSTPECWSTYAGTFNTIMNSFQVLD
jgi:hypothetical protein